MTLHTSAKQVDEMQKRMITLLEHAQTRYCGPTSDSARWGAFKPRAGDIVVNTPPKSGTTWTQAILAMLIAADPEVDAQTSMKSPWIDISVRPIEDVMARLEAQEHRRQVKSHTPFDGLPYWNELHYIAVYRHPIDVHFSMRKHIRNMKRDVFDHLFPEDRSESFRLFVEGDQYEMSLKGIVTHYKETLRRRSRENLLILHYADMLRDLDNAVGRIAAHVGLVVDRSLMSDIVKAATFDSMKANAHRFTPSAGQGVWHSDSGFFDSGTSNKWEGQLTADDLQAYDETMSALLSRDERDWLEWGTV